MFFCFQEAVLKQLPALTCSSPPQMLPMCPSQLCSEHIIVGPFEIQSHCPTTCLQCAYKDLQLHSVMITVSKATTDGYVVK